ncbi:TPA: hypothetical protein MIH81_00255 [Klebsiella pneumoniae]|nr:hypothetical protein [Klebsiella pneumoniae]HBZ7973512.1 hypothetical protein [Klebsiella pneumoniae]
MKNTIGKLKGLAFAGFLFVPCITHAKTAAIPLNQQCKLAMSELNESGKLFGSFMEPWLKSIPSGTQIDRKEFIQARVKNFNKQYAEIRARYLGLGGYGIENPLSKSNDVSLRLQFVVDAFQKYSADGDKEALRTTWAIQRNAMKESTDSLKKQCAENGDTR